MSETQLIDELLISYGEEKRKAVGHWRFLPRQYVLIGLLFVLSVAFGWYMPISTPKPDKVLDIEVPIVNPDMG